MFGYHKKIAHAGEDVRIYPGFSLIRIIWIFEGLWNHKKMVKGASLWDKKNIFSPVYRLVRILFYSSGLFRRMWLRKKLRSKLEWYEYAYRENQFVYLTPDWLKKRIEHVRSEINDLR
jgi:hypothetical protein